MKAQLLQFDKTQSICISGRGKKNKFPLETKQIRSKVDSDDIRKPIWLTFISSNLIKRSKSEISFIHRILSNCSLHKLKLQYPACYVSFIYLLKYQTIGFSNGILRSIVASVITHCQLLLLWRHIRESFLSSALVGRRLLVLFLDRMKYCFILCFVNRRVISNVKFSPPADLFVEIFFSEELSRHVGEFCEVLLKEGMCCVLYSFYILCDIEHAKTIMHLISKL